MLILVLPYASRLEVALRTMVKNHRGALVWVISGAVLAIWQAPEVLDHLSNLLRKDGWGRLQIACQREVSSGEKSTWLLELTSNHRPAIRTEDFDEAGVELVGGEILNVIHVNKHLNSEVGPIGFDWQENQIFLRPGVINSGSRSELRIVVSGLPGTAFQPWRKVGQIADVELKLVYKKPKGTQAARTRTLPLDLGVAETAGVNSILDLEHAMEADEDWLEDRRPRELSRRDLILASTALDVCDPGPYAAYRALDASSLRGVGKSSPYRDIKVVFERTPSQVLSPVAWESQGVELQARVNSLVDREGVILLLGSATTEAGQEGAETALAMADALGEFLAPSTHDKGWRIFAGEVASRRDLGSVCSDERLRRAILDHSTSHGGGGQNFVCAFFLPCLASP